MKKILFVCALFLLLFVPLSPAFADDGRGGQVIFGQDYTLESGQTLDGDLVVFGGNVDLKEDSLVNGSVVVWGGNVTVAGKVERDVAVFGGNVRLHDKAVVDGDVVSFGGNVDRQEGAVVRGESWQGWRGGPSFPSIPGVPRLPKIPSGPLVTMETGRHVFLNFIMDLFRMVITTLALMALGLVVIIFLPEHTERVKEAILIAPLPSLGIGLLTAVVAMAVIVLLAITICLAPVSLVLGIALSIAGLFGWIVIGLVVGVKVMEALKAQDPSPLVAVVVGVVLIQLLSVAPCLGFIFRVLVGALGLGAVVLTRFGTLHYTPSAQPAAPLAPPLPPSAIADASADQPDEPPADD